MSSQYRFPSYDSYIRDLENLSQRERHGLFSQPPPLSVGDKYNNSLKSKGKKKGVLINQKILNYHEPSLFMNPGYISISDPYKDPYKAQQIYNKEKELAIQNPHSFKPTDKFKSMYCPRYYIQLESTLNLNIQKNTTIKDTILGKYQEKSQHLLEIFKQILVKKGQEEQQQIICLEIMNMFQIHMIDKNLQTELKGLNRKANFYQEQLDLCQQAMEIVLLLLMEYYQMELDMNENKIKLPLFNKVPFRPANKNKNGFQGTFEILQYIEEGPTEPKKKQNTFTKTMQTEKYEKPWRPNSYGTHSRPCPSLSEKLRSKTKGTARI